MADLKMSVGDMPVMNIQTAPRFDVRDNLGKIGELTVCRGGLYWKPKSGKKLRKISWRNFDKVASRFAVASRKEDEISDEDEFEQIDADRSDPLFSKTLGRKIKI